MAGRRWGLFLGVAVVSVAACTGGRSADGGGAGTTLGAGDPTAAETPLAPADRAVDAETATAGPVADPVRHPRSDDPIYFVMTDRFANGDPGNDRGGADVDDPLVHGYRPTDAGWYQGGDLIGMTQRLPYLADLGIGAIWITPPFRNMAVQGDGTLEGSSAGYHGYWQIDWSVVDPHLGSEADMASFIDAADDAGIAVYFDLVFNHTGDVITLADPASGAPAVAYVPKSRAPYLDADGLPFDDEAVAGTEGFPELDPAISFPYLPTFIAPDDSTVKWPDWLDDPTLYHNRGNSLFTGENSTYGDFFGLDDLFTEHPAVVSGMIDLTTDLIQRYPIAGVRLDTVKHVNDEFWLALVPAMFAAADAAGRDDFLVFGEVFSSDPILMSDYSTRLGLSGTLDFLLADGLTDYVARGADAESLAAVYAEDDWYTDNDSNASMLVTFFGNHDLGRMGGLISANGAAGEELTARMALGFDLLFLSRGTPIVYYGDEQGFADIGTDRSARRPMFDTSIAQFADDRRSSYFDPDHPLYRRVSALNDLRADHPALADGAQIARSADGPILAFSRIDREDRIEYLVVANNAESPTPVTVTPLTRSGFTQIWGEDGRVRTGSDGRITVTVPPLATLVLVADEPLPPPDGAVGIELVRPTDRANIPTERFRFQAELSDDRLAEVTFAVSLDGADPVVIGTDDAPPYRVYWNNGPTVSGPAVPSGSTVEVIATVDDGSGRLRSASATATLTKP